MVDLGCEGDGGWFERVGWREGEIQGEEVALVDEDVSEGR